MFIERYSPPSRKTLVPARGKVARLANNTNESKNPYRERRRSKDRRRSARKINFKDRRGSRDRRLKRGSPSGNSNTHRSAEHTENKRIGKHIDVVV